jgi:hypothetical protein
MNNEQHKKLRLVMAAVAPLPLPQRLSVLRMAWQLTNQKIVDEHIVETFIGLQSTNDTQCQMVSKDQQNNAYR